MKIPTMLNLDHSNSKAIIGSIATTYTPQTGSNENLELILTQIYKEVCAKNAQVTVNVPDVLPANVNVSLPEPINNVTINQQAQPVAVTFEVTAQYWLIYLNLIMSVIAAIVAIYAVRK